MTTRQQTKTIDRLLRERRDSGYKTVAADEIGVSRQIYDTWESGHHIPGFDWVPPLSDYLGIEEADLVQILYASHVAKILVRNL